MIKNILGYLTLYVKCPTENGSQYIKYESDFTHLPAEEDLNDFLQSVKKFFATLKIDTEPEYCSKEDYVTGCEGYHSFVTTFDEFEKEETQKTEKGLSKIREMLKDPRAVLVFDLDGVLSAFEYGERLHNICTAAEWHDYIATHDPYQYARPLTTMQRFISEYCDPERVFVCSRAGKLEIEKKKAFITKNYPIDASHIYAVKNNKDKVKILEQIHNKYFSDLDPKWIIMIDDTTEVLDNIQETSGYSTAHITSFME